jgi:hypothetical protein
MVMNILGKTLRAEGASRVISNTWERDGMTNISMSLRKKTIEEHVQPCPLIFRQNLLS